MESTYIITLGFFLWFVADLIITHSTENPQKIKGICFLVAIILVCLFVFVFPEYKTTPIDFIGGAFLAVMLKNYLAKKVENHKAKQAKTDPIKDMETQVENLSNIDEK